MSSLEGVHPAAAMIQLTRINHVPMILNSDLIEHIETTPDTVISLTNGQKFVVLETTSEVISKVIEFRRSIGNCRLPATIVETHA
jgi:flagellar protein FlbD